MRGLTKILKVNQHNNKQATKSLDKKGSPSIICPNCGSTDNRLVSDSSGEHYHCVDCDYPFRLEQKVKVVGPSSDKPIEHLMHKSIEHSSEYTRKQLEEPLKQIRRLKLKFRVVGALIALSGIAFLLMTSENRLLFIVGSLYILLGAFLIYDK